MTYVLKRLKIVESCSCAFFLVFFLKKTFVSVLFCFRLQYTGDLSFAIGAVSMLINECDDVIIENTIVNSNDTGNFTAPTMPKLPPKSEEIAQLLCPNDCTFNGKCVNGSCVCSKDYTAQDCSIFVFQNPFIAR